MTSYSLYIKHMLINYVFSKGYGKVVLSHVVDMVSSFYSKGLFLYYSFSGCTRIQDFDVAKEFADTDHLDVSRGWQWSRWW